MEYRKLGKWGIRVSEVGLGSWLTYGRTVDDKESRKQIHFAYENGINFFDTANVYHLGEAEQVVGKAIADFSRDSIVLATKVFFPMGDGPNDKGLSRKHVIEQCHLSLKRLGTDYIDLYQCHRHDPDVPMEELVTTMNDLRVQGKIFYWGVSEWSAANITEAVETARRLNMAPPVSNQPCYNMLHRSIEEEVIPVSESYGLGQVVFSPLAQGILTGKYKPGHKPPAGSRAADENSNMFMYNRGFMADETLEKVERLSAIAQKQGLIMPQLALAWCLRHSNISSVIIGATKLSQIEDNIKGAGTVLDEETLEDIEHILTDESVAVSV